MSGDGDKAAQEEISGERKISGPGVVRFKDAQKKVIADETPLCSIFSQLSTDLKHFKASSCSEMNKSKPDKAQRKGSHKETRLKKLQPLRDCPPEKLERLLIEKIELCFVSLSHSDSSLSCKNTEAKLGTLEELIEYVNSNKLPANAYPEIVDMFAANVFRTFPPRASLPLEIDSEDEDSLGSCTDPGWPSLEMVYHFFISFLESKDFEPAVCKNCIKQNFIVSLLAAFDSPNPMERELLKSVLHKIYQSFLSIRLLIRKHITYLLQTFIYETERHNGIAELMDVMMSIIDGFVLPLKEEHKKFLLKTIMPLHNPSSFSSYHTQVIYCVTQYLKKDPKLTEPVVRAILKFWPRRNSAKEMLFLQEVDLILSINEDVMLELKKVSVPLLKQLCACASSAHIQVAERGIELLISNEVLYLITPEVRRHIPEILRNKLFRK